MASSVAISRLVVAPLTGWNQGYRGTYKRRESRQNASHYRQSSHWKSSSHQPSHVNVTRKVHGQTGYGLAGIVAKRYYQSTLPFEPNLPSQISVLV